MTPEKFLYWLDGVMANAKIEDAEAVYDIVDVKLRETITEMEAAQPKRRPPFHNNDDILVRC